MAITDREMLPIVQQRPNTVGIIGTGGIGFDLDRGCVLRFGSESLLSPANRAFMDSGVKT